MLNIVGHRKWYYLISLLIIIPGLISLFINGLKLSIDFTGGSRTLVAYEKSINDLDQSKLEKIYLDKDIKIYSIQRSNNGFVIRTEEIDEKVNKKIVEDINSLNKDLKQEAFETIGPVIGKETALDAIKATVLATSLIVLYIAISFRKVPKPASSWKFGVCTVLALMHDVLLVLGIFSILGFLFNVEVDSLFVTALLTVIGFSVHDTIVVFDRVRENLIRAPQPRYEDTVNVSINQTLTRSINTSVTALLVLLALLLFGGESMRWFVFALFIGIASGTYSSIFNAAPLLVTWESMERKLNLRSRINKLGR